MPFGFLSTLCDLHFRPGVLEVGRLVPVSFFEQPLRDLPAMAHVHVQIEVALRPFCPQEELQRHGSRHERAGACLEGTECARSGVLLLLVRVGDAA